MILYEARPADGRINKGKESSIEVRYESEEEVVLTADVRTKGWTATPKTRKLAPKEPPGETVSLSFAFDGTSSPLFVRVTFSGGGSVLPVHFLVAKE